MRLILQIARTHLLAKKKQTLIAALGVTFGIAMFILMISMMNGVNQVLEDVQISNTPHVRLYYEYDNERPHVLSSVYSAADHYLMVHHQKPKKEKKNIKNGLMITDEIKKLPGITGVSAQLNTQAFFNYGPVEITGMLVGVNILDEDRLFNLRRKIREGSLEALLSNREGIIMGGGLAKKLHVKTGDKVTITTPRGQLKTLKIVGIFKFGIAQVDDSRSYCNLSLTQNLLGENSSYITEIQMKMADKEQAKTLAADLQKMFGYKAEDWQTANQAFLTGNRIRSAMTFGVVVTMLIVAGFGIYNIMNMTIYDKMKDIAIMKATGFAGKDIVRIFLAQATIIGMLGGVVGLIIGGILAYLLSLVPFNSGGFLDIDTFPVDFDPRYYVFGFVFGVLTTIIAGYMPSRRASKVDPVVILRG